MLMRLWLSWPQIREFSSMLAPPMGFLKHINISEILPKRNYTNTREGEIHTLFFSHSHTISTTKSLSISFLLKRLFCCNLHLKGYSRNAWSNYLDFCPFIDFFKKSLKTAEASADLKVYDFIHDAFHSRILNLNLTR